MKDETESWLFWKRYRLKLSVRARIYRISAFARRLLGRCEQCSAKPAQVVEAMTAYDDDKLNQDQLLCGPCAQEYTSYWEDRWNEYYSDIRGSLGLS